VNEPGPAAAGGRSEVVMKVDAKRYSFGLEAGGARRLTPSGGLEDSRSPETVKSPPGRNQPYLAVFCSSA
jgi:hypothetical protein